MPRNNIMKQINALQKSIDDLEKGRRQRWPSPTPPRLKDTKADRERPKEKPPESKPKGNIEDFFSSNPDAGTKQAMYKNEGDTAPATQSTRAFAESAARRNKASDERRMKEIPPQPVTTTSSGNDYPVNDETTAKAPSGRLSERDSDDDDPTRHIDYSMDKDVKRKPPYKMEYLDEVELDLKGNEISIDKGNYSHGQGRIPESIKRKDAAKAEIGRGDVKRQGPERVRVPNRPVDEPSEERNFDMMRKSVENTLLKLMQYGGT